MNTSTENNSTTDSTVSFTAADVANILIVSVFGGMNIILGLPTNVYVLWLIVTAGEGLMVSNFFALNLSLTEILFCLSVSFCGLGLFIPGNVSQYLVHIVSALIYTGRPLFQTCICMERYLAVVHPVVFLKYKTLRYKTACVGLGWLLVLGSCLTFILISQNTGQSFDLYYPLLCNYLVWFSLKLFCCLAVLRALKRPGPGNTEREGTNSMKLRAFKIILIILITAVINYLPMIITILLKHFIQVELALSICFFTAYLTGFVQPLLFIHRVGKLRCIRCPHETGSALSHISE